MPFASTMKKCIVFLKFCPFFFYLTRISWQLNVSKTKINLCNHSSTIGCNNCNPKLQCYFAICSCSCSSYELKKIATKSCLQLKLAIHGFLQLLVELWLHSGCTYLQCGLKLLLKSAAWVVCYLRCLNKQLWATVGSNWIYIKELF